MAFAGHQRFVVANFDDTTAVENDQAVGVAQRRQAVGDGDRGAPAHEIVERLLDFLLGCCVDRGRGLVEDQDLRIDEQGAGDRDALALAAG